VSTNNPLVSFAILCYNRKEELREALISILEQDYRPIEVIVIDNASTDGTEKLFETEFANSGIFYEKLSENLGVSGGRNVAMSRCHGDFLVILDDDAILLNPHATAAVVDKFNSDPRIGALAFKIVDFETGDIQKGYRMSRNRRVDLNSEFECWGFRGAGHAIRSGVFKEVGPYPDYYPWGHEEMDICLKILGANYKIVYFPQVCVAHHRSERGRLVKTEFEAVALENRIKVAIRNLPWRYVLTTSIVWTGVTLLVRTRFNIRAVALAYWNLWRKRHLLLKERRPLPSLALQRARELGAPLYY